MRDENQVEEKKPSVSWWLVLKYVIGGNEVKFTIAVASSVLSAAFIAAVSPFFLKFIFDEGIIRGDFVFFISMSAASVVIFTLWRIWNYFNRLYIQRLKVEISKQTSSRLLSKYYDIPYNEILKNDSGYFASRIYDEAVATCHPVVDTFISLFTTMASLIVATIVLLAMSWRASLTVLIAIPLIYLVTRTYSKQIKNLSKEEKEKEALLKGIVLKSVSSFKFTKIFNLKSSVLNGFAKYYDSFASTSIARFRISAKYESINSTLMSYAETIAMIGSGYEILMGRMTFGSFMGFMQAYWGVIGSVRTLFSIFPEVARLSGSVERLVEFERNVYDPSNMIESDFLQLEQVSYGYDQRAVLEDFSLNLNNSEKILILGPNGSGKSTLAHIISGLLFPAKGKIFTFPLSRVSAIIYPSDFVPGSLADNVSFIISESEKTRFDNISANFRLDTQIDKDISEFSAGQKKKLEILIGLVKEADIYIFDEPLAGIDVESKEIVMEEIFKYTKDKLLIVVLHGDQQFHHRFDRQINLNIKSGTKTPNG